MEYQTVPLSDRASYLDCFLGLLVWNETSVLSPVKTNFL